MTLLMKNAYEEEIIFRVLALHDDVDGSGREQSQSGMCGQ